MLYYAYILISLHRLSNDSQYVYRFILPFSQDCTQKYCVRSEQLLIFHSQAHLFVMHSPCLNTMQSVNQVLAVQSAAI